MITCWHLTLLVALCLVAACQPPEAAEQSAEVEDEGPVRSLVETTVLDTTEFEEILELTGATEPIRSAEVSAQVGGRITSLSLVEGQHVEQGDTVLRLDAAQGYAGVDRLEVELQQTENDIARTRRLVERGLAGAAELERLESQRAALTESIDEVEVGIRDTRHRAPISGIVTDTFEEVGEFVGQGDPVARIVDIDTIVVRVGLPEREIGNVAEGRDVSVRIEATGELLTGTVARIGVEANPRNRTFPLEIHLDNADGHLRAGMRATTILVKRSYPEAVVIPRDAVLRTVSGSEVFVHRDGVAETREIELGPGLGPFVVVQGLQAGDELVSRGHRTLVQGERIEVSRSTTCCDSQFRRYRFGQPEPAETDDAPDESAAASSMDEAGGAEP